MGSRMGSVFALAISGYLCVDGFAGGWPSIFYTFGSLGIVWVFIFVILTSNSPAEHQCISETEKAYIVKETLKSVEARAIMKSKVPWLEIFRSKACWAVFIAHFTTNWGGYLFLTQMPTYLRDVLKFDIKSVRNKLTNLCPEAYSPYLTIISARYSSIFFLLTSRFNLIFK